MLPLGPVVFPKGFVWGVASSGFQSEGGDVPNDWVFEARRGRVPANAGNGFWERAERDFALVASLGIRHYRLSVEWSRVEPERGRFDVVALDRYRAICDAAFDRMGRYVFRRGLEEGLLRAAKALPGVPLVVTENGCPATDETFRIRYVAAHLAALAQARERGADVRGYFPWTAVDNYEWHHGFSDARFGLIAFDRETQERTAKASARWLAGVIRSGRLDPSGIP
ncbi:MAG: family 1 glycosylhydrolase [Deltaproteobacteria bacterium]|nr:family 1 glycosylhydrolase [Deltaproteobacteria bacterium]